MARTIFEDNSKIHLSKSIWVGHEQKPTKTWEISAEPMEFQSHCSMAESGAI
jgi:hypothetical protein